MIYKCLLPLSDCCHTLKTIRRSGYRDSANRWRIGAGEAVSRLERSNSCGTFAVSLRP
jgi:hypothetical protein